MVTAGRATADRRGDGAVATSQSPIARRRADVLMLLLPGLVAGLGLLAPLLAMLLGGISLLGMGEESIGYRYFYSLRTLYTPDERPWLPQGQTMTIVHLGLQLLLTAAGFPATQITPRIDLFAYLGAALPHLVTAAVFGWAVLPLRSMLVRLSVAVAMVLVGLDGGLNWGYHLLLPDYYSWIHALAMAVLGCCLRLTADDARPTWRLALALGLIGGLGMGLKITLAVFMVPPMLLLLLRWRPIPRALVMAAAIGIVTGVLFVGIIWLSRGASVEAVEQHFTTMSRYSSTQNEDQQRGPVVWLLGQLLFGDSPLIRLSAVLPALLLASLVLPRQRPESHLVTLALLAGSVLSTLLMWRRAGWTTQVEVNDFTLLVLAVWLARVGVPAAVTWSPSWWLGPASWGRRWRWLTAERALLAGLSLAAGVSLAHSLLMHVPQFARMQTIEATLDRFTSDPPGRVAILALDNEHRPLTRDSAIYKGGTDTAGSGLWGASPFVQSLAPDRHYFYPTPELPLPIDTSSFRYLLFVADPELDRIGQPTSTLTEAFGLSLVGFECPLQLNRLPVNYMRQYACRRRPDAPVEARQGEIGFVADVRTLTPATPISWAREARRPLRVGEAAYAGSTREVWRLDVGGTLTRLVGQPGQVIMLDAVGAWSEKADAISGLPARFEGGRWLTEAAEPLRLSRNAVLEMRPDRSIRGWDVLDRGAVTVEAIPGSERAGGLQLRMRQAGGRVGLRAAVDVDEVDGAPISASVRARSIGPGQLTVHLRNVSAGGASGTERAAGVSLTGRPGEWRTFALYLEPEEIAGRRVELVIEVEDAEPGTGLDVEHGEIVAGRLP